MSKTEPRARSKPSASCCGVDLTDQLPTKLFKALCDPTRASLLAELLGCGGEARSVGEVADCCPIDISVVSRHLAQLRDAGVLAAERRGKHVYYVVRADQLVKTLRGLADAIEACCPPGSACAVPDGDQEKGPSK